MPSTKQLQLTPTIPPKKQTKYFSKDYIQMAKKHVKIYPTSPLVREIQFKTLQRFVLYSL